MTQRVLPPHPSRTNTSLFTNFHATHSIFIIFLWITLVPISTLWADSNGISSKTQILSLGQAEAALGSALSTAGDVNGDGYDDVIIAAPDYTKDYNREGAVFLFLGSENGLKESPDLVLFGGQTEARFGASATTAGDVNGDGYSDILVGAPGYQQNDSVLGKAFLYLGSEDGLRPLPDWTVEGPQNNAAFATSLAAAGDIDGDGYNDILIAAPTYKEGEDKKGVVFLYLGSETGLGNMIAWSVQGQQTDANFGRGLATAGDINADGYSDILIGAPTYAQENSNEGRTFLYLGSPDGLQGTPDWSATGEEIGAQFGQAVASAGDLNGDGFSDVALAAPFGKNIIAGEGWVRIYEGSKQGLSQDYTLLSGRQTNAHFGTTLAFAGDHNGDGFADLIVGAPDYDNGNENEGRLALYYGSEKGIEVQPAWHIDGQAKQAKLGSAVGPAGDVNGNGLPELLGGAPGFENETQTGGRVILYEGPRAAPQTKAAWSVDGEQRDALLGESVSSAGDVNGDGLADLIIGSSGFDGLGNDEGRVVLFLGSEADLSATPDWILNGQQEKSGLGNAVSSAGDVNGDGYADVLIAASLWDKDYLDEGQVQLFLGSASGLAGDSSWRVTGGRAGAHFGSAVSSAGDVNGDGYADVLIAASTYSETESGEEGAAFLFLGSASGLELSPSWTTTGAQTGDAYGYAVASAGDVNQDGYSDVLISARLFDQDARDQGAAFLFLGSALGLQETPNWQAFGQQEGEAFGSALAGLGDVNGDGFSDVAISSTFFDADYKEEGRTFVYYGGKMGLPPEANWTANGGQQGAEFGTQLAAAGDLNGDGFADLLVAASLYDQAREDEGAAFVFLGSATGLSNDFAWFNTGKQVDARFGSGISGAGDVNGDGYADLLIGASHFDNGVSNEGASFLYYGNNSQGIAHTARQMQDNAAQNISPLGTSDRAKRVTLSVLAHSPFARSRAKMEWELKEVGQAFDGKQTTTSTQWIDTGQLGSLLQEKITGLKAKSQYHWRLRLLYAPASSPFQSHSRWLTQSKQSWQEMNFRTPADFLRFPEDGDLLPDIEQDFVWDNFDLNETDGTHFTYLFCLKIGIPHFNPERDCIDVGAGDTVLEKHLPTQAKLLPSLLIAGGLLGLFLSLCAHSRNPALRRFSRSVRSIILLLLLVACSSSGGGGGKENPEPEPPEVPLTISYRVTGLTAQTVYHWKVFVINPDRGRAEESEVRQFTSP